MLCCCTYMVAVGCAAGVRFNLQWADKRSQIDYDTHRRGQLVRDLIRNFQIFERRI
jgi:hypothetical protein